MNKNKKNIKKCTRCKNEKELQNFHKKNSKKGEWQKICIACKREEDKKRYEKNKGMWLYYITIDGVIRWVGHTCNLYNRINNHKNGKKRSSLFYEAELNGVNCRLSEVKVYVCNIEELGLNLSDKDLQYYEAYYIKKHKNTVYNTLENGVLEERERYIDEVPMIPLDKLPFVFYKSIGKN